jgi:hypothetical protein
MTSCELITLKSNKFYSKYYLLLMFANSIQIHDNLLIFLLKSDFRKINEIIQVKDKPFEINV